jgi:hypothetical protein
MRAISLVIIFASQWLFQPLLTAWAQTNCTYYMNSARNLVFESVLNLNGNSTLDHARVERYENGDLYLLLIADPGTAQCLVLLEDYLTVTQLLTGDQTVTVKQIELVEVTGEAPLELHIALEKQGGGPRAEVAYHALYQAVNGRWQVIYRSTQCLAFSSFEIRYGAGSQPQLYLDEDTLCQPPFSSSRNYSIRGWDGTSFMVLEEGVIKRKSAVTMISELVCWGCPGLALVLMVAVASFAAIRSRRFRRMNN